MSATAALAGSDLLLRFLAVLLLIALNAFFVAAEFAILSVRRSRINQLVVAGDVEARVVQGLQRRLDRLLSATQLGITLASLALGWIGENTMAVIVATGLMALPLPIAWTRALTHSFTIPLAFGFIAYLQIVLGELCPKAVALLYPEQLARFLGPPSLAIARVFNPFLWILNQSTRWLLRLVRIEYTGQAYTRMTPEELQMIITTEQESTGFEAEERELLKNVFNFGEVGVSEVMIPRTAITALPQDATYQMLLEAIATTGHTRYPVMGESLDNILGIINFKDLAQPLSNGKITLDSPLHPWIRKAPFVPEFMPLGELLPFMQRTHQPMVMVADEFGGTAGLVTLADLVAEIIGATPLEGGIARSPAVQKLNQNSFLVQAQIDIEDVNTSLGLNLPITDHYQTLGGFLLFQFQRVPNSGETLHYQNLDFTVESIDGPRLHQIRIQIHEHFSMMNEP